ncbi:MAG: hypothetical protein ACI8PZ_005224 [Myxococcota bacterium]
MDVPDAPESGLVLPVLFPEDRVLAELEFVGRHPIGFLFITDANFGMLAQDLEWTERLCGGHAARARPGVHRLALAGARRPRSAAICGVLGGRGALSLFSIPDRAGGFTR